MSETTAVIRRLTRIEALALATAFGQIQTARTQLTEVLAEMELDIDPSGTYQITDDRLLIRMDVAVAVELNGAHPA